MSDETCAALLPRRVYATRTEAGSGEVVLTLADAEVALEPRAHQAYRAIAQRLDEGVDCGALPQALGQEPEAVARALAAFEDAGLLVRAPQQRSIDGHSFHDLHFVRLLPAWLNLAFSHPFWDRMAEGRGSARLYAGWLVELYHYTRNANRHMPLAAAHCRSKPVKALLAKHYEEEWNHYHFFSRAAAAMGVDPQALRDCAPLPMTLAMSDFMRQAARTDILGYAICSAVLEGTTVDGGAFHPFYESVQALYGVPKAAVAPIYEHLALDGKYQHADLFAEICSQEPQIDAGRAATVLDFGHQMAEHIWLWTDNIEQHYGNEHNPMPRPFFDTHFD